jgi:hypothetical protein
MFLIMSADYVSPELRSEFGALPPSFLPLGNRRLFQHQVKCAPAASRIFISVPESYTVNEHDRYWLAQHGVTVLFVPDGLSLGASLVASLNLAEQPLDTQLQVLFGDTLIDPLPTGRNIIATAKVDDNYDWAVVTEDMDNWLVSSKETPTLEQYSVVTGYFNFSSPRLLIRCITQSNWSFLNGLSRYNKAQGLDTVDVSNWLDFGHANTYYRSKSTFTTQRVFNELTITPRWIEKSGTQSAKITAEALWFENIPPVMRQYTPQFLGADARVQHAEGYLSYRLEYLHHTALNELFVFAELPPLVWKNILRQCMIFIRDCQGFTAAGDSPYSSLDDLLQNKTRQRIEQFCAERGISSQACFEYSEPGPGKPLRLSIDGLIEKSIPFLPAKTSNATLMHGDFCFSNILYDFRTDRIKVIDPRGMTTDNQFSIYGDLRYDIAKLSHSALGMYDWIIAGTHELTVNGQNLHFSIPHLEKHKAIQQLFLKLVSEQFGVNATELYAMQIHLFLSMLPLHADDPARQDALLANAFRLYNLLDEAAR